MENKKENETFTYTYSARQQEEIQSIRKKYLPREADKMEQLRLLDQSATRKGAAVALIVGIVSALTMGVGMCCTIVWMGKWFIPGIVIGLVGVAGVVAAYPIYTHITRKRREKIAPQILKLTEELAHPEHDK